MPQFTHEDLIALAGIYAQKHGIDPNIFVNQIRQESGFNPNAKSSAGAQGIAQIVPKYHPGVDPMNPVAALDYAAGMMANGIKRYGSVERALSAYNSGRPDAYQNPNFAKGETYNYVRNILGKAGKPSVAAPQIGSSFQPTAQEPLPDLPQQNLQPGQMVAPIPGVLLNGSPLPAPTPLSKQADAFNQNLLQQAAQPAPQVQLPPPVDQSAIRQRAAQLAQSAAPVGLPQAPQQGSNFIGDLLGHAANAASGYSQDNLIRNSGHGVGATAGDLLGGIVPIGGAALLGGAIGEGVGAIPAGIAAAGGLGASQELQNQRLSGASPDLLKAGGMGIVQAGLQALPILKSESLLAAIGKNLLLHGTAGAGASVAQQAIGQGTLTPNIDLGQVEQMAALAGAGGVVGGGLHGRIKPTVSPEVDLNPTNFNPAHSTADAQALTQAFQERTRPETPQLLSPNHEPGGDLLNANGDLLNGTRQTDLVKGSALPEGRALPDKPLPGDLIPEAKSAQESADVFAGRDENTQAAQQLLNDASQTRSSAENELLKTTGINDPVEAQRAVGQRILESQKRIESGETLHPQEGAQLQHDMELLDRVLQSREQERLAQQMFDQEHQLTKRAELPEAKPESTLPSLQQPENLLRSSRDIAMERADSMGNDLLAKPEPRSNDLLQFKPKETQDLILPNREPVPGKVLEFPGRQEPQQLLGPSGKPLISSTSDAGAASPPAEGVEHTLNPQKPITQEMIDAAQGAKQTLMTVAEAERHIRQYAPDQMPHFLNTLEAGKNNQTLDVSHAPLEEGGRVVNQREVNPVGFAKQTITGRTEVANLRKQFEGDLSKVRDNLVQRLNDAGVKVNAADQQLKGNRTDVTRLNALAEKLPADQRTHVYVMDHNLGETARKEGPYGFRRMDRIKDSSLTGKAQELPAGTEHTNQIAPAFQAFRDFTHSDEAPASLKRVSKQLDGGNISKQSLKDLQEAYKELTPEKLLELCKRFGL